MVIVEASTKAFSKVEVDLVDSLPTNDAGYKHILTWQCNLTKYSGATPSLTLIRYI